MRAKSQRRARCSALSAPPCAPSSRIMAVPQHALLHATSLRSPAAPQVAAHHAHAPCMHDQAHPPG